MPLSRYRFYLFFALACLLFGGGLASAQPGKQIEYDAQRLSQTGVTVQSTPIPDYPEEVGDTSFTVYSNCTAELKTYFVHGDQYDNVFNPNPTGVVVNGQYFEYFCDFELTVKQNVSNLLDIKEFTFRDRRFVVLINFREDCLGSGCQYRCYNLFEITEPSAVRQTSFATVFESMDCFGEFSQDATLDYLRFASKPPKGMEAGGDGYFYHQMTCYSVPSDTVHAQQHLNDDGHAYYLYVRSYEEIPDRFEILKADWFFPVVDTSGNYAEVTPIFPEYISFDPAHSHLFDPEGVRIEKRNYTVHVRDFGDLEAARSYAYDLVNDEFRNVFVMVDQYGDRISFQILMGNFTSFDRALAFKAALLDRGIEGKIVEFDNTF